MGYTQYWKHGTYRLDNGTFDEICKVLRVSLDDARSIVGDDAVDESIADHGKRYPFVLDDLYSFHAFSNRYINTCDLGESAMFFDSRAALWMFGYLYDRLPVDEFSLEEYCKPNINALDDAALCAILIAISMNNPDADISSDGLWCEDNWQAGAKLYELACERKAVCPKKVALELRTFTKGNSPAFVHVFQNKTDIYAPYDKKLNGDYTSAADAVATLAVHGYEEE